MAINESYGYGIVNNSEMFGKWKFKNDDLIFEPRGRAIHIKDIIINIEDKSYTLLLTFNIFINEEVEYSLKLEDFNRVGLLQLTKYGADVTENNISTLINVLQNERNDFETDSKYVRKYTHTHLGWDMYNKQHIFKAYLTISNIENFESKYSGNYYLSLNRNYRFPVLFDEFSMNKDYSITDLIYSLIYGKDKSHLNGDSEQKFTNDFRKTIIF